MATYVALVRKEENSDYSVDFPDFPGCITAGETLEEAKDYAAEALVFHIEGVLEDGGELPRPRLMEVVKAGRQNHDAVAFLVDIPD